MSTLKKRLANIAFFIIMIAVFFWLGFCLWLVLEPKSAQAFTCVSEGDKCNEFKYSTKEFFSTVGSDESLEEMSKWIKEQNPEKIKVVQIYKSHKNSLSIPTWVVLYTEPQKSN